MSAAPWQQPDTAPQLRLSGLAAGQQPAAARAARFPGHHCGLFEAVMMTPQIGGSASLFIGPASCLYHAQLRSTRMPWRSGAGAGFYYFELDQEDLALGFAEPLEEAVRQLDRDFGPEVIFLVTTCTPEITGADVAAIAAGLEGEVAARLAVVATNGFACLGERQGMQAFMSSLAKLMEPAARRPGSVNFLASRPALPHSHELAAALREAGLEVNAFVPGGSWRDLAAAPAAAYNIVLDTAALPLAQALEERCAIPWLDLCRHHYLPERVRQLYLRLGEFLGCDLERQAQEREEKTQRFLERTARQLAGVPCAVGAVDGSSFEAALFLARLGMTPLMIERDVEAADCEHFQALLDLGCDPLVSAPGDLNRTYALLAQCRPQIFVGHAQADMLNALGIPHCLPSSFISEPGYAAGRRAAENILESLGQPPAATAAGAYPEQKEDQSCHP